MRRRLGRAPRACSHGAAARCRGSADWRDPRGRTARDAARRPARRRDRARRERARRLALGARDARTARVGAALGSGRPDPAADLARGVLSRAAPHLDAGHRRARPPRERPDGAQARHRAAPADRLIQRGAAGRLAARLCDPADGRRRRRGGRGRAPRRGRHRGLFPRGARSAHPLRHLPRPASRLGDPPRAGAARGAAAARRPDRPRRPGGRQPRPSRGARRHRRAPRLAGARALLGGAARAAKTL
mmetsp:Transcript_32472/g.106257  ORF Transcript_32472/g.106257 Transcript_32472/m.106257 type:complete len:246 (-) Transcript_32472:1-738(-)